MNTRKAIIAAAAAGIVLAGGLSLAAPDWQPVQPAYSAPGEGRGGKFGRHGRGYALGRLCSERREERLADMVGFVESFVEFTPEQEVAWNSLTVALDQGNDRIGTACGELRAEGRAETAPDKMARLETMLEAGLDALRDVRPAFDSFYGTLNAEQKEAIDRLAMHRRR